MLALIGLALAIQGAGGLINNLAGGAKSWFLLNHLEMPDGLRIAAHALMLLAGLAIVLARRGGTRGTPTG
ncbi:hypothetical protein [Allorhizocola rhizosphaerae]|uniref:hypothetical protein n=1 Tax=Allorhizocola rhizosphaerae TaxID=1872709 RepID=UPI000E3C9F3B|nr:hypothetical protein [Allorhizocola rhizosphaerae]